MLVDRGDDPAVCWIHEINVVVRVNIAVLADRRSPIAGYRAKLHVGGQSCSDGNTLLHRNRFDLLFNDILFDARSLLWRDLDGHALRKRVSGNKQAQRCRAGHYCTLHWTAPVSSP